MQQRAYEEVNSVLGSEKRVTQDNINNLKSRALYMEKACMCNICFDIGRYIKQVIDETLRTAVVAPWAARYAEEDIELTVDSKGYQIPKGVWDHLFS